MIAFLNKEIAEKWISSPLGLGKKWSDMSKEEKEKKIERAENRLRFEEENWKQYVHDMKKRGLTPEPRKIIPEQDLFELFKFVNTENIPDSEEQALFKVFKVFSENNERCRQLAEFLNETKIKELLDQDVSQPLSDEFMERIFGEVFDTILAGKGSN